MKKLTTEKMEKIEGGTPYDPWAEGGYCYIVISMFLKHGFDQGLADFFWSHC